jgi:hypothetical protein
MLLTIQVSTSWYTRYAYQKQIVKNLVTSWNEGAAPNTLTKTLATSWNTLPLSSYVAGRNPVIFHAKHTGEVPSGQVIRFRNQINPKKIVYESPVENMSLGFINLTVDWVDPRLQDLIQVAPLLFDDINLNGIGLQGFRQIRRAEILDPVDFPVYVTHEYKSSENWNNSVIRYLGWIPKNPNRAINAPLQTYNLDKQAQQYGITFLRTNRTKQTLNVTVKKRDKTFVSGLLPPNAALCVLKKDANTNVIGYIPEKGLTSFPMQGVLVDASYYKHFFIPLG